MIKLNFAHFRNNAQFDIINCDINFGFNYKFIVQFYILFEIKNMLCVLICCRTNINVGFGKMRFTFTDELYAPCCNPRNLSSQGCYIKP